MFCVNEEFSEYDYSDETYQIAIINENKYILGYIIIYPHLFKSLVRYLGNHIWFMEKPKKLEEYLYNEKTQTIVYKVLPLSKTNKYPVIQMYCTNDISEFGDYLGVKTVFKLIYPKEA